MPASTRSCASGSRSSASSAACERVQRVLVGPQQERRGGDAARSASSSSRRGADRPARARSVAHERARFALPPTSANAWRTRSRAAGFAARAELHARGRAGTRARAPWLRTRSSPGTAAARVAARHAAAQRGALGRAVQAVGHQHELAPARAAPDSTARSRISAPRSWPPTSGRGPAVSTAERRPSPRRTTPSVYGWRGRSSESPCSGRSGSTTGSGRVRCSTTGSNSRWLSSAECSSTSAGPGARLAVGDARAVAVVEEAQLHPRRLAGAHAALERAGDRARRRRRARAPSSRRGAASSACDPVRARRAAPRGADEVAEAERRRRVAALRAAARWSAARVSDDARRSAGRRRSRARETHVRQARPVASVTGAGARASARSIAPGDAVHAASSGGGSSLAAARSRPERARGRAGRRARPAHGRDATSRATTVQRRAPLGLRPRDRPARAARARRAGGRAAVPARRHRDRRPPRHAAARRARARRDVLSTVVSLCNFLTYGTTAQVARLHGAGRGPRGRRARRAGAVARARRSASRWPRAVRRARASR